MTATAKPSVREAEANPPVRSASTPNAVNPSTAASTPATVSQPATVARIAVGTSSAASAPAGGAKALLATIAAR
jgi:hypothetical protein